MAIPGFEKLPLLLTVKQVAGILNMTPKAVYAADDIPGRIKIGGRVRFRQDKLETWLLNSEES